MEPARKFVFVLWSCGPDRPGAAALAAAPFVYALAARALDFEVEMHFTGGAVRWLFEGSAAGAFTDRARTKTVLDFIREAHAAGVRLYACAMALAEHRRGEPLLPEVKGLAGAATVIDAAAGGAHTLVF